MSKLMVQTSEFDKNGDEISVDFDDLLEVTDVTHDGIVEVAIDISPKTDRLYICIPLHELVRLAMIEGREKSD